MNDRQFLALVVVILLVHSLATMHGQQMQALRIDEYAERIKQHSDTSPHQSDFSLSLYGHQGIVAMKLWSEWAFRLIAFKPHKRLYFQRGFLALSLREQAL